MENPVAEIQLKMSSPKKQLRKAVGVMKKCLPPGGPPVPSSGAAPSSSASNQPPGHFGACPRCWGCCVELRHRSMTQPAGRKDLDRTREACVSQVWSPGELQKAQLIALAFAELKRTAAFQLSSWLSEAAARELPSGFAEPGAGP